MAVAFLLFMSLVLVLFYRKIRHSQYSTKSLPGPFQLPILGNTFQLWVQTTQYPIETVYANLAAKFGPIYKLRVGEVDQVVISDLDTIKAVLMNDDWYDRIHHDFVEWARRMSSKNLGLLFSNGKDHKEIRKFSTRASRAFGFGKTEAVDQLAEIEAKDLVQQIDNRIKNDGSIVNMDEFFTHSTFNITWTLVSNHRFSQDDPQVKQLLQDLTEFIEIQGIAFSLGFSMPTLVKLTPSGRYIRAFNHKISEFVREGIAESRVAERFTKGESFFDTFLHEIEKRKNSDNLGPDSKYNAYTEEQMIVVISDLILAGTHTSASTLQFAILALTLNQDVQEKIQEEIDTVIGRDNVPEYSHLKSMPFTEATICEILRMAVVVPLIARTAAKDTTIHGYPIKKSTAAMLNIHSLHMDDKVWENPTQFRPQRFLNEQNEIVNTDKIVPFGLGRRVCFGEKVARVTIFVVLATLLQNFKFNPTPTTANAWLKFRRGFAYTIEGYNVKATRRH